MKKWRGEKPCPWFIDQKCSFKLHFLVEDENRAPRLWVIGHNMTYVVNTFTKTPHLDAQCKNLLSGVFMLSKRSPVWLCLLRGDKSSLLSLQRFAVNLWINNAVTKVTRVCYTLSLTQNALGAFLLFSTSPGVWFCRSVVDSSNDWSQRTTGLQRNFIPQKAIIHCHCGHVTMCN